MDDFCEVAKEVAPQSENNALYTGVDDIQIAVDTCTIILDKKEITLGPVLSAIFNTLALNAGQVVSRDRLRRSVPKKLLDPLNLNAHMSTLRVKLGEARERIQRVPGVGYMYVKPDKVPTAGLNDLQTACDNRIARPHVD